MLFYLVRIPTCHVTSTLVPRCAVVLSLTSTFDLSSLLWMLSIRFVSCTRSINSKCCEIFPSLLLTYADFFKIHFSKNSFMNMIRARNYNASLKLARLKLSIDISTCYIKFLINCLDRCSTCGQRYHWDLPKKLSYFDFNEFETLFIAS